MIKQGIKTESLQSIGVGFADIFLQISLANNENSNKLNLCAAVICV